MMNLKIRLDNVIEKLQEKKKIKRANEEIKMKKKKVNERRATLDNHFVTVSAEKKRRKHFKKSNSTNYNNNNTALNLTTIEYNYNFEKQIADLKENWDSGPDFKIYEYNYENRRISDVHSSFQRCVSYVNLSTPTPPPLPPRIPLRKIEI